MSFLTPRERQRRRIMLTIAAMGITAIVAVGFLLLLATTTDLFVQPTATPLPPTATPTDLPPPTHDASQPLAMEAVTFTNAIVQGETLLVQVLTEPETRCVITANAYYTDIASFRTDTLADYITDASGLCEAAMPTDRTLAAGEHLIHINLNKGPRSGQADWLFTVQEAP